MLRRYECGYCANVRKRDLRKDARVQDFNGVVNRLLIEMLHHVDEV